MRFIEQFLADHPHRVLGLDIVRAIAILQVVYTHGTGLVPESWRYGYGLVTPVLDGVSIFFVLSGFLIGGILLRLLRSSEFTARDLRGFWIRRWFRTIPNYLLVLTVLIAVQWAMEGNTNDFNWRYFFFSQNLFDRHPYFFPEAWSLSVEEWFYLLFPITVFVLMRLFRQNRRALLIAAAFFLLVPFALRVFYFFNGIGIGDWDWAIKKVVVLRLDSLMYGVLGAYLYTYYPAAWQRYKRPALAVSGVIVAAMTAYCMSVEDPAVSFLAVYGYNLEALATLLALPYFSGLRSVRSRALTFGITFISVISYSMYLLHLSLIAVKLLPALLRWAGWEQAHFALGYALYWLLSIMLSYGLYRFYERPMTGLRERFSGKVKPTTVEKRQPEAGVTI